MGALRYWEQEYNLAGARAFLVVIAALSVSCRNYTQTAPNPVESSGKALLFTAVALLFYAVFVFIQTMRHRTFLAEPKGNPEDDAHEARETRSLGFHVTMLVLTLLPVVLLSEFLAVIVDYGIEDLDLPDALGGVLIAILILAPEGLAAFHAALANHLQRALNVCLGWALATIGLTIPAVLIVGLVTGRDVHLGLTPGRDRAVDPYALCQRAHLRRRAHQFAARPGAPSPLHCLCGADLQPLARPIARYARTRPAAGISGDQALLRRGSQA
jgi:Ca2+:H+ antiporter